MAEDHGVEGSIPSLPIFPSKVYKRKKSILEMKRGKAKEKGAGCKILRMWRENPINLLLYAVAFVLLIYGLWDLNARIMLGALIIAVIGHMIQKV